jgi:hypothetical protein
LFDSARQGFDAENRSTHMKEMMKTGDHNLAKRNAEMANDFGSSSFGGLIKMAKTHTNIV